MLKATYLETTDVANFVTWFRGVISGTNAINFQYKSDPAQKWTHLRDVLPYYSWPRNINRGPSHVEKLLNFPENAHFCLLGGSNLETNDEVLSRLSSGLQAAFENGADLTPWVAAIFIWGGVYSETKLGDGNKGWLRAHTHEIFDILVNTSAALQTGDDDLSIFRNLRFNAGMTKVYSLLLKDFVIYDSRVAAALAWLVLLWQISSRPGSQLHPELSFQCLKAKEYKSKKNPKHPKLRNPDSFQFSNLAANPYAHAKWNLRANWILTAAFPAIAGGTNHFPTLRHVEAALFTMGYDLKHAVPCNNSF